MRNAMNMSGHNRRQPNYVRQVPATASRSLQRRPQTRPPQTRQRIRKGNPMRCNKCKTPLSGTFFILKCNCILCEECCCSHFETNRNCPTCNRIMGENDFTEHMVRKQLTPKGPVQKKRSPIFVKKIANSRFLKASDMWYGLQKQHAMLRQGTKFILQQFMKENNIQLKRSSQIHHALSAMKEDHDALKLESHKHKQKVETFKQELILANEKLDEKDRQLNQFRKMVGSKNDSSSIRDDRDHHRDQAGPTTKRPRRVSDQHQFDRPPTRRGDSKSHEKSRPRGRSQDRSNPYNTQPRGGSQERPRGRSQDRSTPYNTQPRGGNRERPRGNPYNGDFLPSQEQNSYRNSYREPPPSRSHSVASTNSGGRIRNITASTPYAFSGSVADARGKLSPSQFYASKAPRGYHSQSY